MKKYIKSTTASDGAQSVEVAVEAGEMINVSNDPDATVYTVDSYEDYEYFMNHVQL